MIITGLTRGEFQTAVDKANVHYDGNLRPLFGTDYSATRFSARVVLRATGYKLYGRKDTSRLAPAQRRSSSAFGGERRINAVCWHGYRDVLVEVFNINPNARVYTALAKYRGRESFYREYPLTGERNVGASIAPVTMPELCDCSAAIRQEVTA